MAKRNYLYKNIITYCYWGTWQADYVTENGNKIPLHRCCCRTKAEAYEIAKREVDFMNRR